MTRTKPQSCLGCACHSHGSDFSAVEGTGSSGVMLIGEASGEMEARDQLPFRPYAPAGSVLTRVLSRMGLRRDMFSITNTIRCRPRKNWFENSPWEYSALRHCRPNLDAAIARFRPRCIVALGGVALRELTGLAGDKLGISYLAGYPLPLMGKIPVDEPVICGHCENRTPDPNCSICKGKGHATYQTHKEQPLDVPVIGDFHPSYLRRGKASHQGVFARILQRALNIAAGKDRAWAWGIDPAECCTWHNVPDPLRYDVHPSLDTALAFRGYIRANPNVPISKDIETPESASMDEDAREGFRDTQIRQIQFSCGPWQAVAFPWRQPYIAIAQDILNAQNPSYGHNWDNYDHKVLRAAAAREGWRYAPQRRVYDTLDMFHHWQPDLPAHLQFAAQWVQFPFPWKHLHTVEHEPWYGCVDVDATWQLGQFLERALRADGIWEGYVSQVYCVRPVLAAMEDRGVPIDDQARLRLDGEFAVAQVKLRAEIAAMAPQECRRVHPKDGYKGVPPEVKAWFKEKASPELRTENALEDALSVQVFRDDKDDPQSELYRYETRIFKVPVDEDCFTPATRWCRVYDFNPNSPQQMLSYIRAKSHLVPKNRQREDENGANPDTTAAKELLRLAAKTGDPFYLKVVEYRGLSKMRGTYIEGFAPGSDRRVHPTFTFATAIAQLSARNPNTQNFPKLKPTPQLAQAMRAMICADPGYMLTEIDFKSCHVITLGHLAGDANYTRLGRLDIHSFVAGHFLNLWDGAEIIGESDQELLARFKWLKSDPERKRVRDDQAKHGILGIGNGLRAKGLYERYMEQFPPRPCPECQATGRVPGVRGTKKCPECDGTKMQSGLSVARGVLADCEQLFPRVFEYQEAQRQEAHDRRELRTPFGHLRRFYEVMRPDPRNGGALMHGDQAEEAVAYRLANVAHAHMREVMKRVAALGFDAAYGLFNQVHDSLMFHHPEVMAEDVLRDVLPLMTAESTVMPGLWLGAEASQGKRWNQMSEVVMPVPVEVPCA